MRNNQLFNNSKKYGLIPKIIHWTSASLFIAAYLVVYYIFWFMEDDSPNILPMLNLHWAFGLLVGAFFIPRIIFAIIFPKPEELPSTKAANIIAKIVHIFLYGLLIAMPLTGYLGTGAPTSFGVFTIPAFKDTSIFQLISAVSGMDWKHFEPPIDTIHHFVGKWVAWFLVLGHIAAALYYHYILRDRVLKRMLFNKDE